MSAAYAEKCSFYLWNKCGVGANGRPVPHYNFDSPRGRKFIHLSYFILFPKDRLSLFPMTDDRPRPTPTYYYYNKTINVVSHVTKSPALYRKWSIVT